MHPWQEYKENATVFFSFHPIRGTMICPIINNSWLGGIGQATPQ